MIVPVQYTKAISPVCKSLAYLAAKKREEEASDYQIDFAAQGNYQFLILLCLFQSIIRFYEWYCGVVVKHVDSQHRDLSLRFLHVSH